MRRILVYTISARNAQNAENLKRRMEKQMALLKQWHEIAYNEKANKGDIQRFWAAYFEIEKGIYEQLLEDPDTEVKGTVKELAEKYGQEVLTMVGSWMESMTAW